jgi:hypothetical protein
VSGDACGDQADHYLGLAGAHVVATAALLELRDNLADVMDAKAMMCVHGDAEVGKTLSVNAALRALGTPEQVCRVQFRARPTPRYIRHLLFDVLQLPGAPHAPPWASQPNRRCPRWGWPRPLIWTWRPATSCPETS